MTLTGWPKSALLQAANTAERFAGALVTQVADGIASRVDVTGLVIRYVDLNRIVASVDLEAVVDQMNLPAIIRSSSGTMASETVREVRVHGIDADAAIARAVSHLIPHRRHEAVEDSGEKPAAVPTAPPSS